MSFTRAHLPNPVESQMEQLDLHIGVVYKPDAPDQRYVAVMLQPSDALLVEQKVGTTLEDWPAVIEVMAGLVDQGTQAWGPMPSKAEYNDLILQLGHVLGTLSRDERRQQLVQHLRSGVLNPGYIAMLRDMLTRVLDESGRGVAPQ